MKPLLFTDLDGCLLNKQDYDYTPAVPVLKQLKVLNIPVVLCSSKTYAEMSQLQQELGLSEYPMTCENGGLIAWTADPQSHQVLGASRIEILDVLKSLKSAFRFRSFTDLGLEGVIKTTNLPAEKAHKAMDRQCTEPLLWDDDPERISEFVTLLKQQELTFTRGGRFWHIAGQTTKGHAVREVIQQYRTKSNSQCTTAAVGDSPIDQSMLDVADCPIGIPQPNGELLVQIDSQTGLIAQHAGAAGWAEAVTSWQNRLQLS